MGENIPKSVEEEQINLLHKYMMHTRGKNYLVDQVQERMQTIDKALSSMFKYAFICLTDPTKNNDPTFLQEQRKMVMRTIKNLVEQCTSRAELMYLFNAYQKIKNTDSTCMIPSTDETKYSKHHPYQSHETFYPLKKLMCDLRFSSGLTRHQDHYDGKTYSTSNEDSQIILSMKNKRNQLVKDYEKNKKPAETIDDSALKNFNRRPWQSSNAFLISAVLSGGTLGVLGLSFLTLKNFYNYCFGASTTSTNSTHIIPQAITPMMMAITMQPQLTLTPKTILDK